MRRRSGGDSAARQNREAHQGKEGEAGADVLISQVVPLKPSLQSQTKPEPSSEQVPPFMQSTSLHSESRRVVKSPLVVCSSPASWEDLSTQLATSAELAVASRATPLH